MHRGKIGEAQTVEVIAEEGEGIDRNGHAWKIGEDGKTWEKIAGGLTSGEARRAYALRLNVEGFVDHYAHERCGFMTLTAQDADMSPKEFGERFNDMRKHDLSWMRGYVRVLEPQMRGAAHYHLLTATPWDLAPSRFDWEALKGAQEAFQARDYATHATLRKRYAQSATPELRAIWAELRDVCERHGLGRSEFLPFRKEAGAVAHYVGKYLEAGLSFRRDSWKGARRVEYDRTGSRSWKRCASSFGWASPGAAAWRCRIGELAQAIRAATMEEIADKLGKRWAYHARASIVTAPEGDWRSLLLALAQDHGGTVERKPRLQLGGEVVAWWPASYDLGGLGDGSSPS